MEKIKNFEELISDYIGPNKNVVDTKVSNLTAPGENYLSEIIRIDVVVQDKDANHQEHLSLVAKLCVEHEFFGPTYNLTKNEIIFYENIVLAIKNFHKRHGLPPPSFYPDYAGGRFNLAVEDDKPDMNAVLILENLAPKGYKNLDRYVGFDLTAAKLILKDLATFHAVPMAMRLKDCEEFATLIKRLSVQFPHKGKQDSPPKIFEILKEVLNKKQKYKAAEKFTKMLDDFFKYMSKHPDRLFNNKPIKRFSTIVHHDMWLNNTMQVIENGKAIKNKFVDFQMCQIGSSTIDLVFLLFSSVELSCLQTNLDNLIQHYYNEFVDILKKLDLYTDEYSYEKFLEEFKTGGPEGIIQCIFMLPTVIFGEKGKVADPGDSSLTVENVPEIALKKLILLCEEGAERGWI
ncbi:uncharacterized protein LOC114325696 [Diabrotica virgifera virgifera]|uniref:CHK kinase-like domain-containing protein n=1 Tax=Diabrotica virgifera virgifera TaxID=50390 RepID=A0ABM5IC63_DIAVI|nr:uncharacterized protein LOC114325696 [Diabrotica virgifera virgifera]